MKNIFKFVKCFNKISTDYIDGEVITVPMFVNGECVKSESGEWFDVMDKAKDEVIGVVPNCTSEEIDFAIESCHAAFPAWSNMSWTRRQEILLDWYHLMELHEEEFIKMGVDELGKIVLDVAGAVKRAKEMIAFAAGVSGHALGNSLQSVAESMDIVSYREPLGVTASINPFNFPLMVPSWFAPLAIATGNTHIMKASRQDPLSCLKFVELAHRAGVPPGVLNAVHGGRELVTTFCTDPRIQAVSFVGGNEAGEYVAELAMGHGKKVQSNMGAKNHGIMMEDCDFQFAAQSIASSGYGAAGQRCMAKPVILLVGEMGDRMDEIVEICRGYKCGYGFDEDSDFGPVVSKNDLERIHGLLAEAEKDGCEIPLDGRDVVVEGYENGYFLDATVVTGVETWMSIYEEEVFGPVLLFMKVDTLDEALEIINDNPYGNGTCIYTKSGSAARKFCHEAKVGQVGINVPIPVPIPPFSFTGSRASFWGDSNVYGMDGVRFFTKNKTITSRWTDDLYHGKTVTFPVFK